MRRFSVLCLAAAATMASGVQAASLSDVVEPAVVMKLDFGGSRQSDFTMGLRLNYSTPVRQAFSALGATPDTQIEALDLASSSTLLTGPSLTQLDFNRDGFRTASLFGRKLVTRHLRIHQNEEEAPAEEGMSEEAPAEEGMSEEAPAEDAAWYDYEEWGWMGWSLAAAGAVGVYFLVDDDDSAPAAAGGGQQGVACDIPPTPILFPDGVPAGCDPDL